MERKIIPDDPSLALCQICANADMWIPALAMDENIWQFRTCIREVVGRCNNFVPANIRRYS